MGKMQRRIVRRDTAEARRSAAKAAKRRASLRRQGDAAAAADEARANAFRKRALADGGEHSTSRTHL